MISKGNVWLHYWASSHMLGVFEMCYSQPPTDVRFWEPHAEMSPSSDYVDVRKCVSQPPTLM